MDRTYSKIQSDQKPQGVKGVVLLSNECAAAVIYVRCNPFGPNRSIYKVAQAKEKSLEQNVLVSLS